MRLSRPPLGWAWFIALLAAMIVSLLFARPDAPETVFGGMLRFDWLGFFFKMLFIFAGAATALLFMDNEKLGHRGEAYLLLLASLLGMNLMAASADLVMLYLAIETVLPPDKVYEVGQQFSLYRWHVTDPIRFEKDLRVTIQALGWQEGGRYLPLEDDIASVGYWYQKEPHAKFPALPSGL